jgi:hypothetical protein
MLDPGLFSTNPGLDLLRAADWLLERAGAPPAAADAAQ